MSWVMVGVGTASLAVGIYQAVDSNQKAKKADNKKKKAKKRMKEFEKSRQPVLNRADQIRAQKNLLSNPAANLGVATQAADIQIQETDKALANTLDSIKQSGMGAGGATALAQAAAQSKAKVAANLESQEANNNKLRAQGEQKLQKQLMDIEQSAIQEEGQAWARQENRDITQLNRLQSEIEAQDQQAAALQQQAAQDLMGGIGGAGSALTGI